MTKIDLKVTQEVRKLCEAKRIKMRKLAALAGTLTSLAFGFKETKKELKWWIRHLHRLNGRKIIEEGRIVHIFTDASKSGWGGTMGRSAG